MYVASHYGHEKLIGRLSVYEASLDHEFVSVLMQAIEINENNTRPSLLKMANHEVAKDGQNVGLYPKL